MWELIDGFLKWAIDIYGFMEDLWNWSFKITDDIVVTFPAMVTTSLIALTALWLAKKFVPLA